VTYEKSRNLPTQDASTVLVNSQKTAKLAIDLFFRMKTDRDQAKVGFNRLELDLRQEENEVAILPCTDGGLATVCCSLHNLYRLVPAI